MDSGRRYRIRHGTSMNIDELDETGRVVSRWCVVPKGELVIGDVLLSQKVGIEVFERNTLAVAHRFSTGSPAVRLGTGISTELAPRDRACTPSHEGQRSADTATRPP